MVIGLGVFIAIMVVFVGIVLSGVFDDVDQMAIQREQAALNHDSEDHALVGNQCVVCDASDIHNNELSSAH